MSDTRLAGHKLIQVGLTTRDLVAAIGFYRDRLGLTLLFEAGGMAFFDLGGQRLMIGQEADPAKPLRGSMLYFDVPDMVATQAALVAAGIGFLGPAQPVQRTPTHDLMLREFADPDGHVLALMGLVPR
jgi:methylmalonyl-CoA/ethylmalonyl-CoA epimerase